MSKAAALSDALFEASKLPTMPAGARRTQIIDKIDHLVGVWKLDSKLGEETMRWPSKVKIASGVANR